MSARWATVDGNEASAAVAYQLSDVIAICPITPSSGMAESVDAWSDLAAVAHAATLERLIVIMGSGAATVRATVARLGTAAKVGVLTVKLFRPFSVADFVAALPPTVRAIAVLDRTKEPGAIGEPLYQDVVTALSEVRLQDLGLMAISYGHVYVAQVAFGAKDAQTLKAFQEAESYEGPSLIIAYSHCIAHGYDMAQGIEHQRLAADTPYRHQIATRGALYHELARGH